MEKVVMYDIDDLALTMIDAVTDDEFCNVVTCCGYDIAKSLIECFIREYDCEIEDIDLSSGELDGYDKEFYVYCDGATVNVEKAYCDSISRYLSIADDCICFIHEDCNSKLININKESELIEFGFEDEDCEEDCEDCEFNIDNFRNDKINSIKEPSTATYKINGKEVDKSDYEKKKKEILNKVKEFDDDYMDMIRDSLLARSHMMDLYCDMLKLF